MAQNTPTGFIRTSAANDYDSINSLTCLEFMSKFRDIWKEGKEVPLTSEVSMFTIGRGKPVLFIISGIHGEERAGPVALMAWAKKLQKVGKINGKVCIIPIMHPEAWNKCERKPGGLNMNRVWSKEKARKIPQVRKVMSILKKTVPAVYLDLHEDDDIEDGLPYICRNMKCEWGKELQNKLGVSTLKGAWKWHDNETSESYAHSVGAKKSFTVESDPTHSLKDRVKFHLDVIKISIEMLDEDFLVW